MMSLKSRLLPALCLATLAGSAAAAPFDVVLDTPRVECAGSSETTISLSIQAGASGAPFGFQVEWMVANADGSCPKWNRLDQHCWATFKPQADNSPYGLGPWWQVVVTLGNLDTSNPEIKTNCPDLTCGTTYCFRIKALAGANGKVRFERSDFAEVQCTTEPCGEFGLDYCSYSQGGFGAPPNGSNPATLLLDPAFPYPVALCSLTFPDQASIEAYLPHGGKPGPISNDAAGGSLAGQVLTARLNMLVSATHLHVETCCTQLGANGLPLGSLKLCFGDGPLGGLNGLTVAQAVDEAEEALCTGVLPAGVASFGDLASIVEQINLNFHGDTTCTDNGHLCLP